MSKIRAFLNMLSCSLPEGFGVSGNIYRSGAVRREPTGENIHPDEFCSAAL